MDMNEAVPLQAGSSIDRLYRNDATAKVRLAVRNLPALATTKAARRAFELGLPIVGGKACVGWKSRCQCALRAL